MKRILDKKKILLITAVVIIIAGMILAVFWWKGRGEQKREYVYMPVQVERTYSDGDNMEISYEYDAKGNLVKKTRKGNYLVETDESYEYEYDDQGRVTECDKFDNSLDSVKVTVYQYNDKFLLEEESKEVPLDLGKYTFSQFDYGELNKYEPSTGDILEDADVYITKEDSKETSMKDEYQTTYENGRLSKMIQNDSEGIKTTYTYGYNKKGKPAHYTWSEDGGDYGESDYKYDRRGNITQWTRDGLTMDLSYKWNRVRKISKHYEGIDSFFDIDISYDGKKVDQIHYKSETYHEDSEEPDKYDETYKYRYDKEGNITEIQGSGKTKIKISYKKIALSGKNYDIYMNHIYYPTMEEVFTAGFVPEAPELAYWINEGMMNFMMYHTTGFHIPMDANRQYEKEFWREIK